MREVISMKTTRYLTGAVLAALLSTVPVPAAAQWLDYPTSGIPRTPDGKPNLAAPTPKAPDGHPDLSGIWLRDSGKYLQDLATGIEVSFQPWAEKLYKEREGNLAKGRPTERCLPHGIPDAMLPGAPFKIVQTPGLTIILFEEFNHYRQILTDGRPFPKDPQPAWFGYSIGKWEGNTMVVDTRGFNDLSWLDDPGHPHTEAMHVTERFVRRDFGRLNMAITIDDPKAYNKPWTQNIPFHLMA